MKELSSHPGYLLQLYAQYLQQSGELPLSFEEFERDYNGFEAPVLNSLKGNELSFDFESDPFSSLLPFPTNQKQNPIQFPSQFTSQFPPQFPLDNYTPQASYSPEELSFDAFAEISMPAMQEPVHTQVQTQLLSSPTFKSQSPAVNFSSNTSSPNQGLSSFGFQDGSDDSDSESDSETDEPNSKSGKKGGKKGSSHNQSGSGEIKQRKKPGRKPKILDEETKKERGRIRQEKNRIAARKCREKKQQYFVDLEQEVEVLRSEKQQMAEELRLLREELNRYKSATRL